MVLDVEVSLLGDCRVACNGRPVTFATNVARALLAYLAVEADRPHPRAHVASLFWPDQAMAAAQTNLRQALSRIRKAFPADIGAAVIDARQDTLQIALPDTAVDLSRFDSLLAACSVHSHADPHTCATCFARRQEAVSLYRGDLLQGLTLQSSEPFEEWLEIQRTQARATVMETLHTLAWQHHAVGELDRMRQCAERQIALDPWRESAHRQLMLALALSGEGAAALVHHRQLARTLHDEIGAAPDAETQTLVDQIRSGNIDVERAQGPAPASLVSASRPITSKKAPSSQLPSWPTPVIGRETDIAAVIDLFRDGSTRMVTVAGEGGVGKTRLAAAAASDMLAHLYDEVWYVPLASITDPGHVVYAIADALAIKASSYPPLAGRIVDTIGDQTSLLLLDNFEQVISAAPVVAELLEGCPNLRVLVTSREMLRIAHEHVYRLQPLALPDPDTSSLEVYRQSGAIQLFIARARAASSEFDLTPSNAPFVTAICRRLDGLPLAIELAAAHLFALSPPLLLDRLERRLPILTPGRRDAPARHRTMAATIDWSHDLLGSTERQVFRRLAAFPGGCTLHMLAAVMRRMQDDVNGAIDDEAGLLAALSSLVAKSLVVPDMSSNDDARYRMLDVIREYAEDKLQEQGESEATWIALSDTLIARFGERHVSPLTPDDTAWEKEIESEYANMQGALDAMKRLGETARYAQLSGTLGWYWFARGMIKECHEALEHAIGFRDVLPRHVATSMALILGIIRLATGRANDAREMFAGELRAAQTADDPVGSAQAHIMLGVEATIRQAYAESLSHHEEALRHAAAIADTRLGLAVTSAAYANMGVAAREQGDLSTAEAFFFRALRGNRECGSTRAEILSLLDLGDVCRERGEIGEALTWCVQSLRLALDFGEMRSVLAGLRALGYLAIDIGRVESGARLLGAVGHHTKQHGIAARIDRRDTRPSLLTGWTPSALEDKAAAALLHAGARLTLDEAVAEALSLDACTR